MSELRDMSAPERRGKYIRYLAPMLQPMMTDSPDPVGDLRWLAQHFNDFADKAERERDES